MEFDRFNLWLLAGLLILTMSCQSEKGSEIDRFRLVTRHNVHASSLDTLESLTVGNGEFAFTVDVTGLQSFPEAYENGMPLGTQAQWGWHSFPNPDHYQINDVAQYFESCNDRSLPVATQHSDGRAGQASHWLRTNPHRLHLGLIGLVILKSDGSEINPNDIESIDQELNLWTGQITSKYKVEGHSVQVELVAHQQSDIISFRMESELLELGRIKIRIRFPYGSDCHTCPGYNWTQPVKHQSEVEIQSDNSWQIRRVLDSTSYWVKARWSRETEMEVFEDHHFIFTPLERNAVFEGSINFGENQPNTEVPTFADVLKNSELGYQYFWQNGGVVDFSGCTDPRAKELERRVILSQYLTKIQCAGRYPPQETGLTCNSWYGKFHLEMHWWHGVHFALWNRLDLLERSMPWYQSVIDLARYTAEWQGFEGVRWQKMTGPEGRISPSNVGEFLAWQQPHPIYFAELIYRQKPDRSILEKYQEIVFKTADFMASFAQFDTMDNRYHLCHPLIPAQEIFDPAETNDPPFELAYWHYALSTAQVWRKRLGLEPNKKWQHVVDHMVALPEYESLYLPCGGATEAYSNDENRRDHPIVLGAYGMLPYSEMIDTVIMANTFQEIMSKWNWQTTWGWDYPMIAMTAARLGEPEKAIEALLLDVRKNTYLKNGHNYQDKRLRLYLPGNGGLLTSVAMMAAGWDGAEKINPGFPADGQWRIKWENLQKMP